MDGLYRAAHQRSSPCSRSKLILVELAFDSRSAVPDAIVHRLTGTGAGGLAARAPAPIRYRVQRGERVTRGQMLAHLGNTGNTPALHLHLHVMNSPSALAGDGLPYVFARFTPAGMLDPEQWYAPDGGLGDAYRMLPGDGRGPRQDELPLDLRIVDFPAAPAAAK